MRELVIAVAVAASADRCALLAERIVVTAAARARERADKSDRAKARSECASSCRLSDDDDNDDDDDGGDDNDDDEGASLLKRAHLMSSANFWLPKLSRRSAARVYDRRCFQLENGRRQ